MAPGTGALPLSAPGKSGNHRCCTVADHPPPNTFYIFMDMQIEIEDYPAFSSYPGIGNAAVLERKCEFRRPGGKHARDSP